MDIKLVTASDWQGVYVDGQLVCENHRLAAHSILRSLAKLGVDLEEIVPDQEWMEDNGVLPENFNDVKIVDRLVIKY